MLRKKLCSLGLKKESEADVLDNTERTSKLAWQCLQIQFWLSLLLDVIRLKVNDENR